MAGEALPDATSTVKALQYVQGQAARGHFQGHSSALLVLYYLVTNMWVKPSPNGQGQCEVMNGRADIASIAAGTALCRRAAQSALRWLAEEEWVDTQRQRDASGREVQRWIYVKLDAPGHRARERRRVMAEAASKILDDHSREGAPDAHTGRH